MMKRSLCPEIFTWFFFICMSLALYLLYSKSINLNQLLVCVQENFVSFTRASSMQILFSFIIIISKLKCIGYFIFQTIYIYVDCSPISTEILLSSICLKYLQLTIVHKKMYSFLELVFSWNIYKFSVIHVIY